MPRRCLRPTVFVAGLAGLLAAGSHGVVDATYFGFYDVSPADLATIAPFSNLYQAGSVADVAAAAALNFTSLLSVNSAFFAGPPGLRSDYKDRWAALEAEARPLVESGAVLGFNLGDELVWNCYDPAAVRAAADAVRSSFPRERESGGGGGGGSSGGAAVAPVIWYNEAGMIGNNPIKDSCGHVVDNFSIPESLDWFSVDVYHMDGLVSGWVNQWVTGFYEKHIFPNITADQKVLLVPGSFGSDVNHYPNGTEICNRTCYDVMCAHDADDFHQWALEDDRVAAIMPWNWGGCASCNGSRFTPPHTCCMDEIGTVDQPLTRAAWARIGAELINGSAAAGTPTRDRNGAAGQNRRPRPFEPIVGAAPASSESTAWVG